MKPNPTSNKKNKIRVLPVGIYMNIEEMYVNRCTLKSGTEAYHNAGDRAQ